MLLVPFSVFDHNLQIASAVPAGVPLTIRPYGDDSIF